MTKFLFLKHWQLFLLMMGAPIAFQIVLISALTAGDNVLHILYVFPIITLLMLGLYFGWFYTVGTHLQKKLPVAERMNVARFKVFLLVPVVYILGICVFSVGSISRELPFSGPEFLVPALIVPLHLFSMFCIFYSMYFIAKALKMVEWRRPVTFSDFAGEFFLIWFFPIGVWFIQPKINAIFSDASGSDDLQTDIKA